MKSVLFVFAALFCLGPVWAQEPDWVRGKSGEYPDSRFITGVGSGATRIEAETHARARIGEVFKVEIKSSISMEKTENIQRSGITSSTIEERTKSRTNGGIHKTLEGTEIADTWQDPMTGRFYALAVLDRSKASARLAGQIEELDTAIVRMKRDIDFAPTKIDKLKLLLLRKSLLTTRGEFNSDYRIVSPSGAGIEPPYHPKDEMIGIMKFLQNDFIIGIKPSGPGSDVVVQTITDRFTGSGLRISKAREKDRDTTDLLLGVDCLLEPSEEQVGHWYYCRWHVELNAVDAGTGAIIFSVSKGGRSGQLSVERSKNRAIYDMNKAAGILADRLITKLSGNE